MQVGCVFSFFQFTDIHVFAGGFHLTLYLTCDSGDAFRYFVEDVAWANLLEHVARGRGNIIGRLGQELSIDQVFGGTCSTAGAWTWRRGRLIYAVLRGG